MKKLRSWAAWVIIAVVTASSCGKEYSCEQCWLQNQPPVANAGSDITTTLPSDSVVLNGEGSIDPDGSITGWRWSFVAGPASPLIRNAGSPETIIAALVHGMYYFELTVTDNSGATDADTVSVIVNELIVPSPSRPPEADAGADQVVLLPASSVLLNGSASSDPDNNIASYEWTAIPGNPAHIISFPNLAVTSVINLVEGTYYFKLKVTDTGGLYDEDTVQVQVRPPGPQGTNDVHFFFRDVTGSLDQNNIRVIEGFSNPTVYLVKVKIAGYPEAKIGGVWSLGYTPICPAVQNYVDMSAFGTFTGLPEGTYSWDAESITTNLAGYSVPGGFASYWSTPHATSGTLVIPPGAGCIIHEIVF